MDGIGTRATPATPGVDVETQRTSNNQVIAVEVRKLIKERLGEDDSLANQQDVLSRLCKIISGEQFPAVSLAVLVNGHMVSQPESTVSVKLKPAQGDWGKGGLSQEGRKLVNSNCVTLSQNLFQKNKLFFALIDECQEKGALNSNAIQTIHGEPDLRAKIRHFLTEFPSHGAKNAGMVIEFLQRENMFSAGTGMQLDD